jgi:DNA mismatch repair protein MutS
MQRWQSCNLLRPGDTRSSQTSTALDPQCVRDPELESILAALTDGRLRRFAIREVFLNLCTDPAVIAYRQDILDDLWRNPDFSMPLEALLPDLNALEASRISVDRRRSPLQEVTRRLGELEYLVSCVTRSNAMFTQVGDNVRASGALENRAVLRGLKAERMADSAQWC